MKKILSLLGIALFGAMSVSATIPNIIVECHLNFREHNLIEEANFNGIAGGSVSIGDEGELVLNYVEEPDGGGLYCSLNYTFDPNKTYFIGGDFKSSTFCNVNFWTLPNWGLIETAPITTEWRPFCFTFTPTADTVQLGIQNGIKAAADYYFKDLYFGESHKVETDAPIGKLPDTATRGGHPGKWQIDGIDINPGTAYRWGEDKYADIKYETTDTLYLNLKEHDLVYEVNGYDDHTLVPSILNNELVLTAMDAGSGDYYLSNSYTFEEGKTYFLSGEYKTTTNASAQIMFDQSETQIHLCEVSPGAYTSFYVTFTPGGVDDQFRIECLIGEVKSTFTFKNFYFGECREVTEGSAIGYLPTPPEREGHPGKWQIDGIDIDSTTTYEWDYDKNANIKYESIALHLNFKEHDLVYEINRDGSFTMDAEVDEDSNELILTADSGGMGDFYLSNSYTFEEGKTYFLSGEYETYTDESADITLNQSQTPIYSCEKSPSAYTSFYVTFTPGGVDDQFRIECKTGGPGSTFFFKNFYFGECREVIEGSAIGGLPAVPAHEGYSGKWQIDGIDIESTTIYEWNYDKNADIKYDLLHLNFKEHDLVEEAKSNKESPFAAQIQVDNNELVLTSTYGGVMYSTLEYALDSSKTYFISGEFKSNKESDMYFLTLPDWGLITKSVLITTEWNSFYFTFSPTNWEANRLGILRGNPVGPEFVEYRFRNFYFGECHAMKKGAAIGNLPETTSTREGYDTVGWEINGKLITPESIFEYDNDVYADVSYKAKTYRLAFTDIDYAKSTEGYKPIGNVEYSSDGTTLTIDAKETDAVVFLPPISANKTHLYMISFDLETEGDPQIDIGIDKKSDSEIITEEQLSPSTYSHYSFEFTAEFTDPSVDTVTSYIKFNNTGKAYLKNILIADLDDSTSIDVTYDSKVGTLPPLPIKEYDVKWTLNGEDLTENTIYRIANSSIAYLKGELNDLVVTFKQYPEDSEPIASYQIKYGQKLSDVISELPKVPDVEGKTGKWVLDGKEVSLDTPVFDNITILASYVDLPPTPPTPEDGGSSTNIGLILGVSIPGAALAGSAVTFLFTRKRKIVKK